MAGRPEAGSGVPGSTRNASAGHIATACRAPRSSQNGTVLSVSRHSRGGECGGENDCAAACVKALMVAAQGMTCSLRVRGAPSPAA